MPRARTVWLTFTCFAMLIASVAIIGGCSAKQQSQARWRGEALGPDAPLALAVEGHKDPGAIDWEYARRDLTLGAAGSPYVNLISAAEVRHYERLRDVNGRPRNHTWTFSRSIQRRVGP